MKKMILIFALLITTLSASAQRNNEIFISAGSGYLTKGGSSSFFDVGVNAGYFMAAIRGTYTSYYNEWIGKAIVASRFINTDIFYMYAGGAIGFSEYNNYFSGNYPPNHPEYRYNRRQTEISLNYGAVAGLGFNVFSEYFSIFGEADLNRNHRYKETSVGFHVGIRIHFGWW